MHYVMLLIRGNTFANAAHWNKHRQKILNFFLSSTDNSISYISFSHNLINYYSRWLHNLSFRYNVNNDRRFTKFDYYLLY
jgi:hypothetical protein